MNKVMIDLYLPAAGVSYDMRIPANCRIGEIIPLLEHCMAELEEGYYIPTKEAVLCERTTGVVLDINVTPMEMGIINGTRLMLI